LYLALRECGTPVFFFFVFVGLKFTIKLFKMKHELAEYQTRHTIPNLNEDSETDRWGQAGCRSACRVPGHYSLAVLLLLV
jgi:hypothetical protein